MGNGGRLYAKDITLVTKYNKYYSNILSENEKTSDISEHFPFIFDKTSRQPTLMTARATLTIHCQACHTTGHTHTLCCDDLYPRLRV